MLCLLIQTAHFIKILLEFFHYWRGRKNLYFVSESAQPTEELIADRNLDSSGEMLIIIFGVDHITRSEAIHEGVQKHVQCSYLDVVALALIHSKMLLEISVHRQFIILFCAASGFSSQLQILHAVNAIVYHLSHFVIIAHQIIVPIAYEELIGAYHIPFTTAALCALQATLEGV